VDRVRWFGLGLVLTIFGGDYGNSGEVIRRGIVSAHKLLHSPIQDLSIAIVPARKMASLHITFLNQPGPTDVLTFELEHDRQGRPTAGEIVICSTIARKNAVKLGHSVSDELLLYAIHGLLHLSGFDDRTASAFAAMHAKEDEILTRLGVGPIFSAASSRKRAPTLALPRRPAVSSTRGGDKRARPASHSGAK
jgi:probable rRNA maturation factor